MVNCTILFFALNSCAIKVNPDGGEKDVTPPKVLQTVPANYSVNFNKKEFRIKFDEYVDVREPGRNLIVSPLLNELPEIKIKGHELIITINDTLKANTTYT